MKREYVRNGPFRSSPVQLPFNFRSPPFFFLMGARCKDLKGKFFLSPIIHVHIRTYSYICSHTYYIQVYMYTYVHTGIHVHIHTYRYTCTHTYIQVYMSHTYIQVYMYTYIHTGIHVHIRTYRYTFIHVYMYTYIHTGIHVHIRTYRYTCTRVHNTQSRLAS